MVAAFSSLITMETEEAQIATGLRRRGPDVLDAPKEGREAGGTGQKVALGGIPVERGTG
jgi:hypothetical protein